MCSASLEDMKMYFCEKRSEGDQEEQIEAMRKYFEFTSIPDSDVIFCASISAMNSAIVVKDGTDKPLIVYCWDYYLWAHEGRHPGSWNWERYAELLKSADAVIVPSRAQQKRLKELLGLDAYVVLSGVKQYNMSVQDNDFILDPVRYYPEENEKWAENAAEDLGIPIVHSEHQYSEEEFRKLVATCSFMTCAYREASTGGLTLAEGLYLGKPSLVSNSPYMGARDYLGEYGYYFQYDDFRDLKHQMAKLWRTRPKPRAKKYVAQQLSFDQMAKGILDVCERITRS